MKKVIKGILFSIYLVIAVALTLLLLAYNDFKVSEFGNYTLLLMNNSDLSPDFNKGDLVILNKDDEIVEGKKVFFYDTYSEKIEIRLGVVEDIEKMSVSDNMYTFEGERRISDNYIIGPANTAKIIPNLGTVLSILESKWGFLFLIVFPAVIAVVNQIGIVCSNIIQATREVKNEAKEENKE